MSLNKLVRRKALFSDSALARINSLLGIFIISAKIVARIFVYL